MVRHAMSARLALVGLVLFVLAIAVVMSMQPGPQKIIYQCGGWYGYNPQTGRCDLGMPSGPPYPPPWATP